jgi:hypothetical protein
MSALVMGTAAKQLAPAGDLEGASRPLPGRGPAVPADDIAMIATSYPEFFEHMAGLGANVEQMP